MVSHTESKKARDTWHNLMKTWVNPFGLMELVVVDHGSEFPGDEFADFSGNTEFWFISPTGRARAKTDSRKELLELSRRCCTM